MAELPQVLCSWWMFLYLEGRYRLSDSGVSESLGGATVTGECLGSLTEGGAS
jgi:hypothetical protein